MANHGGARSSSAGNNESLIIGILVGMVLGLAVAGGVAWYLAKKPSPFTTTAQATHDAKPAAEPPKPAPTAAPAVPAHPAPQAVPATPEEKQRFEFYRILTDKQEGDAHAPKSGAGRPAGNTTAPVAPAVNTQPSAAKAGDYFLQAGSFSTAEDADKLKARIALIGLEASVQPAVVPGKGVRYRVRLGPYHTSGDMNKAVASLKQNGIVDTAPVRAQ